MIWKYPHLWNPPNVSCKQDIDFSNTWRTEAADRFQGPNPSSLHPKGALLDIFRSWNQVFFLARRKLVGGLEHFLFSHILGISSSQLTKSYFSEGFFPNHQPESDWLLMMRHPASSCILLFIIRMISWNHPRWVVHPFSKPLLAAVYGIESPFEESHSDGILCGSDDRTVRCMPLYSNIWLEEGIFPEYKCTTLVMFTIKSIN